MKKLITLLFSLIIAMSALLLISCDKIGDKSFTVTFNANGGSLVSGTLSQTVKSYKEIEEPVFERAGYGFIGWDKELSDISSNTEICAEWSNNIYNLSFDYKEYGGSSMSSLVVKYDEPVNQLPTPVRTNYRFLGWYFDKDGTEQMISEGFIWEMLNDVKVKAKWEEIDACYSITLKNVNPEDESQVEETNYWSSIGTELETLQKEGYVFLGWLEQGKELDESGNKVYVSEIVRRTHGDKTFIADWQAKKYTVEFREYSNEQNYVVIDTKTYEYNQTVGSLPTLNKENYLFLGWYFDKDGIEERFYEDSVCKILNNLSVKAKWMEINEYCLITLIGANPEDDSQIDYMNYWSLNGVVLKTPKKDGYEFLGWLEHGKEKDEFGNKVYVSEVAKSTHGDKTFIADWRVKTYTVEFREYEDEQNFTVMDTRTYDYNQMVLNLPIIEKEKAGNSFKGWIIEYNGQSVSLASGTKWRYSNYPENEVVVAKDEWSRNTYNLYFDMNGGSPQLDAISFLYDTTVFGLPTPQMESELYGKGCFLGWFIGEREIKVGDVWDFDCDQTAVAKWEDRTFDVSLYKDNGEEVEVHSFYLGSIPSLPIPVKEGYTFEKWYFNDAFTKEVEFDMPFTEDKLISYNNRYLVNLFAKWEKSAGTYTITYVLNGGKFDSIAPDYYVMSKGVDLVLPERKGYDFAGFRDGEDLITFISAGESGDKELIAEWSPKAYSIIFEYGEILPIGVLFESNVPELPVPEKKGYTFSGWVTSSGVRIKEGAKWIYDFDLKLYPQWTEGSAINYYLNGGSFTETVEEIYYDEIEYVLPKPVRSGYTFKGWFNNPELSGNEINVIAKGEYGIKNFYAKWEQGAYTVKFAMSWTYDGYTYVIRVNNKASLPSVTIAHGEKMGTKLPSKDIDKIQVSSGKESMYFVKWVYIANGKRYEVKPDTVFNEENLVGINGCEITLYPYLSRTWIPEPQK